MKKFIYSLFIFINYTQAQSISDCKNRFDTYLNFKGKLNSVVRFNEDVIFISNGNKQVLKFYNTELNTLKLFFEKASLAQQMQLIEKKGDLKLSNVQLDSLKQSLKPLNKTTPSDLLPLSGVKVALDPGHFATTLKEAAFEQKYLHFVVRKADGLIDTVLIFESLLAYQTAAVLKNMFEAQGAEVFVTRNRSDFTSFDCTYSDWLVLHKKRVLDSLKLSGALGFEKYNLLLKAKPYDLFWNFFRDFDLTNRANKINQFQPDVTLIIHFNVDEKNAPWTKTSLKNFTMAFIGGAFVPSDLQKNESLTHFSRMLLSSNLNLSEQLAATTVHGFNKNLNIPIATSNNAEYLSKNCLSLKSDGVFCRNLLLCRKINSVLVYGESLFQDNEKEVFELMKTDRTLYGIATNQRVEAVVKSYFDAVLQFYKKN